MQRNVAIAIIVLAAGSLSWYLVPVHVTLNQIRKHPRAYEWRIVRLKATVNLYPTANLLNDSCDLQRAKAGLSYRNLDAKLTETQRGLTDYMRYYPSGTWTGIRADVQGRIIPNGNRVLGELHVSHVFSYQRVDVVRDAFCVSLQALHDTQIASE